MHNEYNTLLRWFQFLNLWTGDGFVQPILRIYLVAAVEQTVNVITFYSINDMNGGSIKSFCFNTTRIVIFFVCIKCEERICGDCAGVKTHLRILLNYSKVSTVFSLTSAPL